MRFDYLLYKFYFKKNTFVYNYQHLNISSFPRQACLPAHFLFQKNFSYNNLAVSHITKKKHKCVLLPVVAQKTEPSNLLSVGSPTAASTVQRCWMSLFSFAQRLQSHHNFAITNMLTPKLNLKGFPSFLSIRPAPNLPHHKTLSRLHLDYYYCADAPLESAVQNNKRKLHAFAVGIQAKWKWVSETKRRLKVM